MSMSRNSKIYIIRRSIFSIDRLTGLLVQKVQWSQPLTNFVDGQSAYLGSRTEMIREKIRYCQVKLRLHTLFLFLCFQLFSLLERKLVWLKSNLDRKMFKFFERENM